MCHNVIMKFVKIQPFQAGETLAGLLTAALEKYPVVTWFVPGGSNIKITVEALAAIPDELKQKLILAQTDERYGPLDHPDSNWKQLLDAGLELGKAKALPVLSSEPLPLADRAEVYSKIVAELIKDSYKIGQFGIGDDGHIAGIKPDTPASVASGLVIGYEHTDFIRITLTFSAIRQMNEAYAFVFGENKRAMLEELEGDSRQLIDQPAQILKSIDESIIYNDQIGEEKES